MADKHPLSGSRLKNDPLAQQLPLVTGKWLLGALAGIFGGGLALVYLTSCLLFWQGQWQILYKPDRSTPAASASAKLPFEEVHFATTETGQPRLDGWFIPAPPEGRYSDLTLLYLHSMQTGSLADAQRELGLLHSFGINIFAFDYRGFGKSQQAHPSESLATEDTEAAWEYLVNTRHIPAASIVLYGRGLGAALAVEVPARHPDAAVVVLDMPEPTALELLRADPRSRWMPLSLLAHDRFDPTNAFSTVKQPTLFLLLPAPQDRPGRRDAAMAADPKMIVDLPTTHADRYRLEGLRRFLDELPRR